MRYILHPGEVMSRTDGDRHYIDAFQLARLYGVDWKECIVFVGSNSNFDYTNIEGDVHLYPRYDGDCKKVCTKCKGHQTSTDGGNRPCKRCNGTGLESSV